MSVLRVMLNGVELDFSHDPKTEHQLCQEKVYLYKTRPFHMEAKHKKRAGEVKQFGPPEIAAYLEQKRQEEENNSWLKQYEVTL